MIGSNLLETSYDYPSRVQTSASKLQVAIGGTGEEIRTIPFLILFFDFPSQSFASSLRLRANATICPFLASLTGTHLHCIDLISTDLKIPF